MKKIYINIFIILFSFNVFSQSEIDSLKKVVKNQTDTTKFKTLLKIGRLITFSSDTTGLYVYLNQLEKMYEKNGEYLTKNNIYDLSVIYIYNQNFDKYVFFTKDLIKKYYNDEEYDKYVNISNNLAYYYSDYGFHEKAIQKSLQTLEFVEKHDLKNQLPYTYLILGFVYRNYELYDKALEYFQKTLEVCDTNELTDELHTAYNEIGNIYNIKKDYKKALEYLFKALKIRKKIQDFSYLGFSYNDIAYVYTLKKQNKDALKYYYKAIYYLKADNDLNSLVAIYNNIASIYLLNNNYDSVRLYLNKALKLNKTNNNLSMYIQIYNSLSQYYRQIDSFKKAYYYLDSAYKFRDSVFKENTSKELANWEKKYEIQKRDNEILKVNESLKRQKILTYSSIIVILLIIVFSAIILSQLKLKKRAFNQLEEQNYEILQQKEEIEIQKEELEEQRDTIRKQNSDLTSSITYATHIQQSILPPKDLLDSFFKEYFVFYKPKSIVSGDFYWVAKAKSYIFFSAADCTGHGVPGAFMSVLGISLLNEIVAKFEGMDNLNIKASSVIEQLKTLIIKSLRQSDDFDSSMEGIDLAMCIYNSENNKLQFSGAYNSLYLVRNNQLKEIKADRMPAGISWHKQLKFTNHQIEYHKNDIIYMFSDGFADQFGGEKYEKFTYKRLKDLIKSVSAKPLNEQKNIFEKKLTDWMSKSATNKQVDDIIIMGVKIF